MRTFIHGISSLALLVIGIYMIMNSEWPTPPMLSGISFIVIAVNIWLPVCPVMEKLFPKKK